MSLWKGNTAVKPAPAPAPDPKEPARVEATFKPEMTVGLAASPATRTNTSVPRRESLIAADITIEGKIEGGGSIRIAGKFKGDVNVQGDLAIEAGATLTGNVRADKVTIAGELEGNVEGASRVELLQTATVIGDLKTRALAVEAGATMRGKAEFGGEDTIGPKGARHSPGNGAESGTRQ